MVKEVKFVFALVIVGLMVSCGESSKGEKKGNPADTPKLTAEEIRIRDEQGEALKKKMLHLKSYRPIPYSEKVRRLREAISEFDQAPQEIVTEAKGLLSEFESKANEEARIQAAKLPRITIRDLKMVFVPIRPGGRMKKWFWMGQTEVTQAQYMAIMGRNPSRFKKVGNNAPVECVPWNSAVEFCKKLTARERKAGRLPSGQGYRLPTEAEWEYCCRAGTTTQYSFGDSASLLGAYGWYKKNSRDRTHVVATRNPNPWGLYDMHGNVGEWCSDRCWFDGTKGMKGSLRGSRDGHGRVFRGGCYSTSSEDCRSGKRANTVARAALYDIGFRVVRVQYSHF